jgi:hypothetical protein
MGDVAMRCVFTAVAGILAGALVFAVGSANAQPAPPPGPIQPGSTSDELADMVMDVIEHDGVAAPTTTPVVAAPQP